MGYFLTGANLNVVNYNLVQAHKYKNAHEARKLHILAKVKEIEKRHLLMLRSQSLGVNHN